MRDAARQGLAVGFFDGVHLGHQAILKGADAALTFRNHPLTVLVPEKAPRLIMSVEERVAAIKACGVGDVTVLDFTPELAEMSAEEFVREHLLAAKGRKGAQRIRCGENWRFGKGGAGDAEFLRRMGFVVDVVPYAEFKGELISSSRIRGCLERGEIEDANAMLGRRFQVSGFRFQGKGLGGKIGYPTVNLRILERESCECGESSRIALRRGVYEVELGGAKAIANYGTAPTMGDKAWGKNVLEVHLLEDSPDSFDSRDSRSEFCVSFLRFIRPEKKFDSIDDLQRQIAADCATITT